MKHTNSLVKASKYALCEFEQSYDWQMVYVVWVQMFSDSTTASLSADSFETQLRALKLNQSWKKLIETFYTLGPPDYTT